MRTINDLGDNSTRFVFNRRRDSSIDQLRGIAIICMVIAHTIFFLNTIPGRMLHELLYFGNNAAFTTFLFCYGVSLYFSLISKPLTVEKYFKRLTILVLSYYVIAFPACYYFWGAGFFTLRTVIKVLTFVTIPYFSEFMVPFIIYYALCGGLVLLRLSDMQKLFASQKHLLYLLLAAMVISISSNYLFDLTKFFNPPGFIMTYISLFIGYVNFYRFPILQYLPILTAGLYCGYLLVYKQKNGQTIDWILPYAYGLLLLSTLLRFSSQFLAVLHLNLFDRWPPSLLFLSTTLGYSLCFLITIKLTPLPGLINRSLIWLGQNALGVLIFHLDLIYLATFLHLPKATNAFLLLIWLVVLLGGYRLIMPLIHYRKKVHITDVMKFLLTPA